MELELQTAGIAIWWILSSSHSSNKPETYNGTSWTEGNDLNTARANGGGFGT